MSKLYRKPLDVPLAQTLNVPDHKFKCLEVEGSHSIKADVEDDE